MITNLAAGYGGWSVIGILGYDGSLPDLSLMPDSYWFGSAVQSPVEFRLVFLVTAGKLAFHCSDSGRCCRRTRRGGRAVEGARLESVYR